VISSSAKTMKASFSRIGNCLRSARHARRVGYLWLICICFSLAPIFAGPLADPGLVYCPLQKAWVKKGREASRPGPLKNICASDAAKLKFSYESFRRLGFSRPLPDGERAEALFFKYTAAGNRAFRSLEPEQAPERQSITAGAGSETGLANSRSANDKLLARPAASRQLTPAVVPAHPSPERPAAFDSKIAAQRSRPRAPPIFL
jgi:hypothetical protein